MYYVKKDGKQSKKGHFRADGQLMAENRPGNDGAFARRAVNPGQNDRQRVDEVLAKAAFFCIVKTSWTNYNYVGLYSGPVYAC